MATGPRYKVAFRRRREGRTDYHQRLRLLLSREDRVVVRKSARHMQIQLVAPDANGDLTLSSAISKELAKYGYEDLPVTLPQHTSQGSCLVTRHLLKAMRAVYWILVFRHHPQVPVSMQHLKVLLIQDWMFLTTPQCSHPMSA